MTNAEKIRQEIGHRMAAGFTIETIRHNLLLQHFNAIEIDACLQQHGYTIVPLPSASTSARNMVMIG